MSVYDVTIVSPKILRNVLTCLNEKVQIKNVKMETLSLSASLPTSPYFRNCDRHKPNNFVMAALNSSHKLHDSCT